MPIYEYHCSNCNKEFEKLMGFSDPKINSPECPECQSNNTNRRLSKVASFNNRGSSFSNSSSCGSSGGFS
ncbi:MAG: zinc ribbon domain-containing protein [Brevefilum sp.]|nr:zinc ribbon domain-containing protein [Brevefilum sp.]MDT8382085.1 zinc ribbon domain-containing protein [Brevefilum sp.]MDW7755710.1 zinc ribbon domain-containing protein [Brevefilum sp.]